MKNYIEHILQDLISFKTISSTSNQDIVLYLEDLAKKLGFSTYIFKNPQNPLQSNLFCCLGKPGKDALMLCGHLDVVPVNEKDWHSDPFLLTSIDDCYVGRGVVDMKGFIAACFSALHEVNVKKINKSISLLFTYDEENGCHGSLQAISDLSSIINHVPKNVIIGEPTDFSIIRMHKGHITIKIEALGKAFHSSMPDQGVSAIKILHKALAALFKLEEELIKEIVMPDYFARPFVVMNVGLINGGNAINIIPQNAYALVGIRVLPITDTKELLEKITQIIMNNVEQERIKITLLNEVAPLYCQSHDYLDALKPLSNKSNYEGVDFTTDAGNLAKLGLNCLIFGPGNIKVAHTPNEWIKKNDLQEASDKLCKLITSSY